jgi:hypothetical protein
MIPHGRKPLLFSEYKSKSILLSFSAFVFRRESTCSQGLDGAATD